MAVWMAETNPFIHPPGCTAELKALNELLVLRKRTPAVQPRRDGPRAQCAPASARTTN